LAEHPISTDSTTVTNPIASGVPILVDMTTQSSDLL
jgi:hypothetical protein